MQHLHRDVGTHQDGAGGFVLVDLRLDVGGHAAQVRALRPHHAGARHRHALHAVVVVHAVGLHEWPDTSNEIDLEDLQDQLHQSTSLSCPPRRHCGQRCGAQMACDGKT